MFYKKLLKIARCCATQAVVRQGKSLIFNSLLHGEAVDIFKYRGDVFSPEILCVLQCSALSGVSESVFFLFFEYPTSNYYNNLVLIESERQQRHWLFSC